MDTRHYSQATLLGTAVLYRISHSITLYAAFVPGLGRIRGAATLAARVIKRSLLCWLGSVRLSHDYMHGHVLAVFIGLVV
jgi:hypothetical protein